jgi:hypothetical protein
LALKVVVVEVEAEAEAESPLELRLPDQATRSRLPLGLAALAALA